MHQIEKPWCRYGCRVRSDIYPIAYHGFDQPRPMRKVLGYTMAYDREATVDSRKRYIEFFIKNLTAELKAAPPFFRKGPGEVALAGSIARVRVTIG